MFNMIEVELNLMLADIFGCKHMEMDIGKSISLGELAAALGFAYDDVGMLLINKQWAPLEGSVIRDGDRVQLYPFMEGG